MTQSPDRLYPKSIGIPVSRSATLAGSRPRGHLTSSSISISRRTIPSTTTMFPKTFCPLPLYESLDVYDRSYLPGSHVSTLSVQRLDPDVFPGGDFILSCRAPQGAVLALPHGSHLRKLENLENLRVYAATHAENWFKYINGPRGRGLYGSLYLVTGCEKASSWGLASFHTVDNTFQLSFKPTPEASGYRWRGNPAQKKYHDPSPTHEPNQTTFIHGLSISLGTGVWARMFETVQIREISDMESRLGGSEGNSNSFSQGSSLLSRVLGVLGRGAIGGGNDAGSRRHVVLSDLPPVAQIMHPGELINNYILAKAPQATVVMSHDDDWCDIFGEGNPAQTISDLLQRIGDEYVIVEKGGATFLQAMSASSRNESPELFGRSKSTTHTTFTALDYNDLGGVTSNPLHHHPAHDGGIGVESDSDEKELELSSEDHDDQEIDMIEVSNTSSTGFIAPVAFSHPPNMQAAQRPMGPRAISSPSPAALSPGTTPPLVTRKSQRPSLGLPSLTPPAPFPFSFHSPSPNLTLSKPKISLAIPSGIGQSRVSGDSPQGGYYGGPVDSAAKLQTLDNLVEELTIRPDSTAPDKEPSNRNRDFTSVEIRPSSSRLALSSDAEDDAVPVASSSFDLTWSDDMLEEICRLGEGADGPVHKVKDKRSGKIMARKTISTREAPMKQLLRELSIISSTEHINIILFYGAYMSPSSSEVKILTEFCEGGSLEAVGKRIKERNATVGEKIAGRLAEGILQGLAYLHTKRTIHRDIKPSHILLSREGIVKLCDFGVSGELIGSQAGTFTGTTSYMAPERIVGQKYTIRSDVWSTGISLLELVQNRFPFPNDLPPIELMMYITAGEPPRLQDEPGLTWSDDMKDFIKQTLTVDALTRPTPKEMLAHPWVVNAMKQEVHMARWIRQVWGWPKTSRRSLENSSLSRSGSPPSAGAHMKSPRPSSNSPSQT
ncbi:Kinase-like protein [Mycena venus]|uniref:mitogen-activated protein kinase kinase n=1 Tax=Mycena venus TaxID=2733690 RepID=A0A8H6Z328_9AGAR|nr:Kinase-like protein [Mycena venus]